MEMLAGLKKNCTFVIRMFKIWSLNDKGVSALTEMPFFIEIEPQGYFYTSTENLQQDSKS